MQTVTNLDQITTMVTDHYANGTTLYVRTSTGIDNDRAMGCSTNHQTGQRENGMSVTTLVPHAEALGVGDPKIIAMQIMSWAYVAPVTYILTGDAIGFGADGEIVLDPETWVAVATIDTNAIQVQRETGCQHEQIDWYTTSGFCRKCNARIEKAGK